MTPCLPPRFRRYLIALVVLIAVLNMPAFGQSPQIEAVPAPDQLPAETAPSAEPAAMPLDELPNGKPMPVPQFRPPFGQPDAVTRPVGVALLNNAPLTGPRRIQGGPPTGQVEGSSGEASTEGLSSALFSSKSLISDPSAFPWRMNVKIWMRFSDGWYVCSGSLVGDAHVLTAGHCINKGGNGTTSGEWTSQVIVVPGYNNGNEPFGRASAAELWSWSNWVSNSDFNGDMGWIVLNRSVSVLTGWFGYGWNSANSFFTGNTFHNPGYPAESPFNGERMYYWSGNFDRAFPEKVEHDSNPPLSGGQSGSGAHYFNGTSRWQYAVASHTYLSGGVRVPPSGYTRMTQSKFDWTADLDNNHRPTNFDLEALDVNASPSNPIEGMALSGANVYFYNKSKTAMNSSWCFNVYLSTNDVITTSDTFLGTRCFSWNFAARSGVWVNFGVTMPDGVSGTRYLGVILNSPDANVGNNTTNGWDAQLINIRTSHVLSLGSSNPNSGVVISVSPADVFGSSNGTTTFTRRYLHNASVNLTAPSTAGGNNFVRWDRNGSSYSTSTSTSTTLTANASMVAVYAAPAALEPVLECVRSNGDGTYTAFWGYSNTTGSSRSIGIGANNGFNPIPVNRGQPTTFLTGTNSSQLAVIFDGTPLTWSITFGGATKSATASSSSPACGSQAILPLIPTFQCLTDNRDGTYNGHMGYRNRNAYPVYVPVGSQNMFATGKADRKQPTIFKPGTKRAVLIVPFNGSNQTWNLTGNSASFSSTSPMCLGVTPTLQCVAANSDGTYTARFGHVNPNTHAVYFKKGSPSNKFVPNPAVRTGMKNKFAKGTKPFFFAINFDGSSLKWRLDGQNVIASSSSTACSATAPAMAVVDAMEEGDDPEDDEFTDVDSLTEAEVEAEVAAEASRLAAEAAGASQKAATIGKVTLEDNYPDPFNPSTQIRFSLPETAAIRLAVYDVAGHEVAILADGPYGAGTHQVTFEASSLPSGAYFVRLVTPQAVITKTMMLVR